MNRDQVWKNFDLGKEVSISGAFVYDGLRCLHEMKTFRNTDQIFQFLYNLSVGLERLLKVTVTLLEHDDVKNQEAFEKSLITHDLLCLLRRVKRQAEIAVTNPHHRLLGLLGRFYKTLRYDRFSVSSEWNPDREAIELIRFVKEALQVRIEPHTSIIPTSIDRRIRSHIGKLAGRICTELFRIVKERAQASNFYTYELRNGSKAEKIFLREEFTFEPEDTFLGELLVYFTNTQDNSGLLEFMRSLNPLPLDPGLTSEYVRCFQSMDELSNERESLEVIYEEVDKPGERLKAIEAIGNPNSNFDIDEPEDDDLQDDIF